MKKILTIALLIITAFITVIMVISTIGGEKPRINETATVALILNGEVTDKSWGQSHYEGIGKSASELGFNLVYRENVPQDLSGMEIVDELVAAGSKILVFNSFGFRELLNAAAEKYPEVYFYHATGVDESKNIASFFGRIYQMRYLCGIAAGLQTETNEIGYVAAFPISEVNRGINAFTLGVRAVNPDAEVYVSWCNSWGDDDAARISAESIKKKHDIDVMAYHTDSDAVLKFCEENGVWSIGYNMDNSDIYPKTFLTAAVWDWEKFYTPKIRLCLQNKFIGTHYWESFDTGIVSLSALTDNVKGGTEKILNEKKELLLSGLFDVFYGPIKDNEGNIRIADGESMSDYSMLNEFDWYVEGVEISE